MILYCRRKFRENRLHLRTLPSVSMSHILESNRYSELHSDDEDDETNEKEKPTESFPPAKENPYQDDDEHIYEYAQPL